MGVYPRVNSHVLAFVVFFSRPLCSSTRWQILEIAAAVERGCRHPLADAVVVEAETRLPERAPLDAEGLCTVPGMGARAKVKHPNIYTFTVVPDVAIQLIYRRGFSLVAFGAKKVNITDAVASPQAILQRFPYLVMPPSVRGRVPKNVSCG